MHQNAVGEKYGRKLWLWTQSREGAIWEDLLTDCDGQYAELQSGRAFNQPRLDTVKTPFKHPTFSPGRTDSFVEKWGVVRDRNAYKAASSVAKPRPVKAPADLNWQSAYGHFLRGQQALREREDALGEKELQAALELDAHFVPALAELAMLSIRRGDYSAATVYAEKVLAIDTYEPAANYAAGFAAFASGDLATARERLGLAAYSAEYRNAARSLMARASLREGDYNEAVGMAERVLANDAANRDALLVRVVALRKAGRNADARSAAENALELWPLFHAVHRETEILQGGDGTKWRQGVRGEFPEESFLEAGDWYAESGLYEDAKDCWQAAGDSPIAKLRLGEYAIAEALPVPRLFPYRREDVSCLERALSARESWKFKY
jgi:tetratricopeptide (TPR) repeat protein